MRRETKNENILNYIYIMIGATILAAGINMFFASLKLVTGGVSGLAIVIEYLSIKNYGVDIPLWFTNIVVNIPLLAIAIKLKGRAFVGKSMFAAAYLSFALFYTSFIPVPKVDLLIASIFGGVFVGIGLGFVLRASASTGGTDLAANIIKVYLKNIPIAKIILVIDSTIILLGAFVFGIEKAMYALISTYIVSKVIDSILEGINFSKAVFIISDYSNEIAEILMKDLNRGVTGIHAKGMYSKGEKQVLFVVVGKDEIVPLQKMVKEIDTKAFITIADVREVLGEGFTE
ncbi:YitT family protein [Clostridium estertheticum]|uniref:YitT family protein n=1 Tax=Clostridium estertheticum TaxID=238834 RepID=A0AA47I5D4_9CLOT|nr:YitT family protein [Clostridium estertheticum]MBU3156141.1 YitT family protein [Clostridium estertheticum]MBU3199372.1 YitT family protein [Clostridium estertheticum]WAG58580.1 YitT family protein [Clostridium estertheticum]WAG67384.1 YitT family protein [Clostridium estertheticum]